ncbi:MAG TPA: serine hydrolase domain-containing protein [Ohtaekwangia sp.]|uniref:serine hydrolase domain-containing protein n=1 Tax=Ohtaekwangia sp. TaxID=2066019 RepID=UPI002F933305
MKRKRALLVVLLVITLPLLLAQVWKDNEEEQQQEAAAPIPAVAIVKPYNNPEFTSILSAYEQEIKSLMQASGTPGAAIAIVKDSSIVYLKGFGLKAIGQKDSVDINTVFRIASVSKCFAAFLTGTLVADSTLSWDDHVIDYLPSFTLKSDEYTKMLTLRHVLSHSTGLPYHTYTNLVEEGIDLTSLLDKLKEVNVAQPPGKEYSYQNVAYSLIGEVIHTATRKTYDALMKERVFIPLNMKTASLDYTSFITNPDIARPHLMRRGQWKEAAITNTYYNVAPAGGVNASISDMAHWMLALLGNRKDVITPETLAQLFTPQVAAPSKNRNYGRTHHVSKSYYGLGWRILYYPDDTLVYHGGYVNGYRSEVAVNVKDRMAICLLANAPGTVADTGIPIFLNMFRAHRDSIIAYDNRQRVILAKKEIQ